MLINTNDYFARFAQLCANMTQYKAWEQVEVEWVKLHKKSKYESFDTCKTSFYRWVKSMMLK